MVAFAEGSTLAGANALYGNHSTQFDQVGYNTWWPSADSKADWASSQPTSDQARANFSTADWITTNESINFDDMFAADQMSPSSASPFDVHTRIAFIVLYGAVFICCSLGNLLVIIVVLRHQKMRTTTNFFLANLAVADLSVGIFCVLPNLGLYLSPYWILGKVMCKLLYFVQMMSYAASITILTVISVERYFAIIHPFRCKQWKTLCLLRVIVVLIWFAAALCGIPQLIFYSIVSIPLPQNDGFVYLSFCIVVVQHNQQAYVTTNFVLWYLLPLSLMTLMYSRISVVLWRSSMLEGRVSKPAARQTQSHTRHKGKRVQLMFELQTRKVSVYDDTTVDLSEKCPYPTAAPTGSTPTHHRFEPGRRLPSETEDDVSLDSSTGLCFPTLPKPDREAKVSTETPGTAKNIGKHAGEYTPLRGGEHQATSSTRPCVSFAEQTSSRRLLQKNVRFCAEDRTNGALLARRRVIRLLIAVIGCFAFCVLPYHVLMMWQTWRHVGPNHQPTPYGQMLLAPIIFLIFYLNSALNPILYAFLSDNFRRSLRELLHRQPHGTVSNPRRRSTMTSKTNQTSL